MNRLPVQNDSSQIFKSINDQMQPSEVSPLREAKKNRHQTEQKTSVTEKNSFNMTGFCALYSTKLLLKVTVRE